MIPKPLDQIEWADLELLRDSGRGESDTIEFKGSFSGGDDYLAFTDAQREKAIKGIAREAIAFLNGRGGDIVIGAQEQENDNPKIKALNPLPNVSKVADRLAQSLSSVIEPYQSVLGVRAIASGDGDEGALVVRAPQSLRAPHRYTRDNECYVRRGRESVAMPMDEIQNLSVQRSLTRDERKNELRRLFVGFEDGRFGRDQVSGCRFHVRIAFVPFGQEQIELSDQLLAKLTAERIKVVDQGNLVAVEDAFLRAGSLWKPVLRGRAQSNVYDASDGEFLELVGRELRSNGAARFDIAFRTKFRPGGSLDAHEVVPASWIVDFFACTLGFLSRLFRRFPALSTGLLAVSTLAAGPIKLGLDRNGRQLVPLQNGLTEIEDFEILGAESLEDAFCQLQHDLYAHVEKYAPRILSLAKP